MILVFFNLCEYLNIHANLHIFELRDKRPHYSLCITTTFVRFVFFSNEP